MNHYTIEAPVYLYDALLDELSKREKLCKYKFSNSMEVEIYLTNKTRKVVVIG